MSTVEKIVMSMLGLILLYLVVMNAPSINNTISAIGKVWTNQIGALQGA